MNKIAEIFDGAIKILNRGWCQKAYAMGEKGNKVLPSMKEAVLFCGSGAMERFVIDNDELKSFDEYVEAKAAFRDKFGICIETYNDLPETTKEDVIKKFIIMRDQYAKIRN